MQTKYLYSAAVQGIQNFIFQTGKLKEIVGASEYIQQVCTIKFKRKLDDIGAYKPENWIIGSAGKITYLFDNREDCEKIVLDFLKGIQVEMPEIVVTQAVVKVEGDLRKADLDKIEAYLECQRNTQTISHGLGLMITERARRTGGAGFDIAKEPKGDVVIDRNQKQKLDSFKATKGQQGSLSQKLIEDQQLRFPQDVTDIAGKDKEWLAIVHADGNNMGKKVQEMMLSVQETYPTEVKEVLRSFSEKLDAATVMAAKKSLNSVLQKHPSLLKQSSIPLRPVLLGGDDLTLIIRGDLAIDFIEEYLKKFQEYTAAKFQPLVEKYGLENLRQGLTACAGIAFIKPNYPFHYGVDLAESLTKTAKKVAKRINFIEVPACLSFHKVHSSFIEGNYDKVIERELIAGKEDGVNFSYGPYFIEKQDGFATIQQLKNWAKYIEGPNSPASNIREWLTELHINRDSADFLMDRINNLHHARQISTLGLDAPIKIRPKYWKQNQATSVKEEQVTHLNDILVYTSIVASEHKESIN